MDRLKLIFLFALVVSPSGEAAKILTLSPFFGKSHSIFMHSITKELARRGHDLTVITTNILENPPGKYRQIQVDKVEMLDLMNEERSFTLFNYIPIPFQLLFVLWGVYESAKTTFNTTAVKDFIKNDDTKYDLILTELFFQESTYMFAHKYKAPIVALASSTYFTWIDQIMGNPSTTFYIGHELSKLNGDLSLLERVKNFLFHGYYHFIHGCVLFFFHNRLANEHFSSLEQPLPRLEDIDKNISMVLLNTHFSFDNIRPLVPGVVEIGGVHIEAAKKLPENIQAFLDGAKDGAIFVSLGSQLKSSKMAQDKKEAFFKAFGKLKQRVIWKWEDDNFPKDLKNVLIGKWLPQNDILAHPNIKAFVTHGGMMSSLETVNRGIPIIGIPIYGDQPINVAKLVERGMGVKLVYADITEEIISDALDKVLNQKEYAIAAKEVSDRFHDRPDTPMETAMFWIEYAIRHKGAKFLKSKAVHLPWYQLHGIDVYAFIIISFALKIYVSRLVFSKIKTLCSKNKKQKGSEENQKRKQNSSKKNK